MLQKKLLYRLLDAATARASLLSAALALAGTVSFACLPFLARAPRVVEAALLAGIAEARIQYVHGRLHLAQARARCDGATGHTAGVLTLVTLAAFQPRV